VSVGHDTRRTRARRTLWIVAAFVAVAAAAAAGAWWWRERVRSRQLDPAWTPIASILAGDGVSAVRDGGVARARFSDPFGVAAAAGGTVYVADAGDAQRIRRVDVDGTVSSMAGGERGYADGLGSAARFDTPSGLAVDARNVLYVADTGNNSIRRVTTDGAVTTLAGSPEPGYVDGRAEEARFNGPVGVAVHPDGRVIVADTYNDRIRAIHPDGLVVTLAGDGVPGFADGSSDRARFDTPCGVAVDTQGRIYVADSANGAVRLIAIDGNVTTLEPLPPDGLFRPFGIAVDTRDVVYVTDDRGRVVEITPGVRARVLAGSRPGFAGGWAGDARFRGLAGIAVPEPGRLVVTEQRNAVVRTLEAPSRRSFRAQPLVSHPQFNTAAFDVEPLLWPLAPMDGPYEITGTLGELRGGDGSERFHAGIDMHAANGEPVVAVRPGVVVTPLAASEFGTLNESVRIGPLAYVHLRVGRYRGDDEVIDAGRFAATYDETERITRIRAKRGARFHAGEPIGTVNAFNHVHLNVGWPGEELNPLHFRLVHFSDSVPPTIARRGIQFLDDSGAPFTKRSKGRLLVDGIVHIVVDAWDQVDGNQRRRRLGLYRLGYQVLDRAGAPVPGFDVPQETIRFDRLFWGADAALVYASGSGIPFYGRRTTRFLYRVTNTLRDGVAERGGWDTTRLSPGDYTVRILAADISGNEASQNRDVAVTVTPAAESGR
jgi:sugar lactone lactonase YvrE